MSQTRRLALFLLLPALLASLLVTVLFRGPSAAAAPSSTLSAGGQLRAGQSLQSNNGNFQLSMQSDGNLVLYTIFNRPLWQSGTGGRPGAFIAVQTDGNVVLYSGTGKVLQNWNTQAAHGDRLTLQDDGNLVIYSTTSRALWATLTMRASGSADNPAASAMLRAGSSLNSGASLISQNGGYHAAMQSDGNFVIYGPGGTVRWAANSAGWAGARMALQADGNLVLYAAGGAALWSTQTRSGWLSVLSNSGSVVVYSRTGAVVWQSNGAPRPTIFPPATSAPPISTSHYLRNIVGDGSTNTAAMNAMGCTDARYNPAGHQYVIVMHIGAQQINVNGTWGVIESASTNRVQNSAIVTVLKSYIDGYSSCMASYSRVTIAAATNNDDHDYGIGKDGCRRPPAGVGDPLGAAGGQVWGHDVVAPLAAYAARKRQMTFAGSNDIEPGFEGCADQAIAWTRAYLAATAAPYVFIGSADGCPTAIGATGTCNYGWTQRQLYDLAYGLSPNRSIPMPQIYNTDSKPQSSVPAGTGPMARQWANMSLVGVRAGRPAIQFGGPLTEVTACAQAGSCGSIGGVAAWNQLWSALRANSQTKIAGVPYLTDLRIN